MAGSTARILLLPLAHSSCGWGHGGTRNRSTSRKDHTRSVSPAAIAGVQGCHRLTAPFPLVGWESINNPGEQMRRQLSSTSYLAVVRAQVFPYPPTC